MHISKISLMASNFSTGTIRRLTNLDVYNNMRCDHTFWLRIRWQIIHNIVVSIRCCIFDGLNYSKYVRKSTQTLQSLCASWKVKFRSERLLLPLLTLRLPMNPSITSSNCTCKELFITISPDTFHSKVINDIKRRSISYVAFFVWIISRLLSIIRVLSGSLEFLVMTSFKIVTVFIKELPSQSSLFHLHHLDNINSKSFSN